MVLRQLATIVVFAPLLGALAAGLQGKFIGKRITHYLTTTLVAVSFAGAVYILSKFINGSFVKEDSTLYVWGKSGGVVLQIGFLLDRLTAVMLMVVTSISLAVHVYSIGYMAKEPGYQRFFSYISLFTFAMLMLVTANNFLQLFFGWEGVGLVSYLLIGFWFKRESAAFASLKAFLVNRVGDLGFLIGIAAILHFFGSLDYWIVFGSVRELVGVTVQILPGVSCSAITLICVCLFIGAMGKSAQVPLHVWLPDSMEGPTPISALIHAATMVTAGVFMVARMSPLFEFSETALSMVMLIGAITCFFMGLLGVVQNDIKRIIAYSTLSQLGYMVVALGASAYAVSIFHLMTHAFFKALLFLGAGSVIMAMHHQQDIRRMGRLKAYMPITYVTMLLASLALIGFPGFSGFYSKDLIIAAVSHATIPGAKLAYFAVTAAVFITALYTFRMFFLVFHTKERMDLPTKKHLHESPWIVTLPLIVLAVPSVIIGGLAVDLLLIQKWLSQALYVANDHTAILALELEHKGAWQMLLRGLVSAPFYLAMAGVACAWYFYVKNPLAAVKISKIFAPVHSVLLKKYGFDLFNQLVIVPSVRGIGWLCWKLGDHDLIDGFIVNGTANSVDLSAKILRKIQTGYIYHYAFIMLSGVFGLLVWLAW